MESDKRSWSIYIWRVPYTQFYFDRDQYYASSIDRFAWINIFMMHVYTRNSHNRTRTWETENRYIDRAVTSMEDRLIISGNE